MKKLIGLLMLCLIFQAETCKEKKCSNNKQNGSELGVDCGGPCPTPCCENGVQDEDEVGVDCGGPCATSCCNNGIQDGNETAIDCGGDCASCCSNGRMDAGETGVDCGGSCPTSCCENGIQDQGEEEVDCGGTCPNECANCNNGIQDGDELGKDCGGSCTTPCPIPHSVVKDKELMITNSAVVNSQEARSGDFSFGKLLENMKPDGMDNKAFILSFLESWLSPQNINGFTVAPRNQIENRVIQEWKRRGGQSPTVSNANWNVDLSAAPFVLMAVVNRMDLTRRDANNVVQNAGEGRFVYSLIDSNGNPEQFTIIMEYELPAKTEAEWVNWGRRWHRLGEFNNFNQNYLNALKEVTEDFAGKNAMPSKTNGSALNQLRTNENALNPLWELREFILDAGNGGRLSETDRKVTPDDSFRNNTAAIRTFIEQNATDVGRDIPLNFQNQSFRSGNVFTPTPSFFWNVPGISSDDRHQLSLNTCNGCHGGETATAFTMIKPRSENGTSNLAGFLTGISVGDPLTGSPRNFNDLEDRAILLKDIVGEPSSAAVDLVDLWAARANRVH